MRALALVSSLAISAALAACATQSTGLQPGPEPEPDYTEEQAFFEEKVAPIFEQNCSNCHANAADDYGAPDFLGVERKDYYGHITDRVDFVGCDVNNSMLLLKGADPNHAGVALPPNGRPLVEQWLDMEAVARFGGICSNTTPPPPDPNEPPPDPTDPPPTDPPAEPVMTGALAMKQFGDCMKLEDWLATGMYQVANQNTNFNDQNDVKCYSCHDTSYNELTGKWVAVGGNHMPDPGNATQVENAFQAMRYMYDSFNLVRFTVSTEDGSFKDLVPSYRWRDKGIEGGTHPTYELSQEYMDAYEAFFQLTYDRWMSGVCGDGPIEAQPTDPPQP